jgi:hypothetical protein
MLEVKQGDDPQGSPAARFQHPTGRVEEGQSRDILQDHRTGGPSYPTSGLWLKPSIEPAATGLQTTAKGSSEKAVKAG